ncbi:phi LC3 family holin [Bacillus oleivorans]|uniref:Phi LC3 family holin n=1 Tax=Bacillus oleivorans TaxID=1448271 RepID=A0A285D6N1_9BACI|nr:phage holin [Bacillus oleivorans]SNX75472.1 phi LC3 family holin [Bacillus oleivorans]
MINWKVRFKNPTFIFTVFIPGLIFLTQMILSFINTFIYPIGFTISDDAVNGLLGIVNFIAFTFFGIGGVIDPTTKGIRDSIRARKYTRPM